MCCSHSIWVNGQCLTSLGHNQCTRILFINISEHQSCGTIFCENHCKTTKPSSCLSEVLLGEEPHTMDVLPIIPYLLWLHGQGLTSLKHNQYTVVLSIQPLDTQAVGPDLVRTAKNHVIPRLVHVATWRRTGHGCVTTHLTCFGCAWERSDKPTQTIH